MGKYLGSSGTDIEMRRSGYREALIWI